MNQDDYFMGRAVALAKQAWGKTHPNPQVGALIVEGGAVVAEGFHAQDGGPHAERAALANLGRAPKSGATMYVTLEPCSTHGRTGACCEAIRAAGIRRVVAGATDPNPAHGGRGFELLRAAGVEVVNGVRAAECTDLNLIFNHLMATGLPMLAAKVAITLDGKIACRTGESKWITGELARADVHTWRRYFPGIAAGAATIMKDNPKLTARLANGETWCPLRFVFDGRLRTVTDGHLPDVYTDEFRERTVVVTTQHGGMGYVKKLRNLGVKVWVMDTPTQRVGFADFRGRCLEEKVAGVYFEGGAQLISELMRSRQLDYLFAYRAPVLLADDKAKTMFAGLRPEKMDQAVRLADVRNEVFGDDSLMRGRVVYPEKLLLDETVFSLR